MFFKKGVLRNFAKFTGKHLCQSLFFNKVEKRLWHSYFPVNFAKILRTPFFYRTPLVAASEFCEISKNNFSYRTPPVAACDLISKDSIKGHVLFFTLAIFRWHTVIHWANSIWNHFHLVCQT